MSKAEVPALTQEMVDEEFAKMKAIWDEEVEKSGKQVAVFIATDDTGFVRDFIGGYANAKFTVEAWGLEMPVLVEGLEVFTKENEDEK